MRRPHNYHPTADDRATTAQWSRGVLSFYTIVALVLATSAAGAEYLSSAPAPKATATQSAALTVSEPARLAAPEMAQGSAAFETATDRGGSEALVENAWDFNHPETIPGFGPIPPSAPRVTQQEQPQSKAEVAVAAQAKPGIDIRAMFRDHSASVQAGLVENDWDFNHPETIPGFGALPTPDAPHRVARGPKNPSESTPSSD